MTSGYYYETDSFLHSLNPLSKVVATVPLLILSLLVSTPWPLLSFSVFFILTTLILGKIPLLHYLKILIPLFIFSFVFLLTYPIFVNADLVENTGIAFEIASHKVYWGAIIFGVIIALRMITIITSAFIFSFTTPFSAFVSALIQQWKLPYKIGYTIMAAYRFIPMIAFDLYIIRAAHKIRGVSDKGLFIGRFKQVKRYTIPLLSSAIRKAERTALAMDNRAFGAFKIRSYYYSQRFKAKDYIFILSIWSIGFLIVLVLIRFEVFGKLIILQMP